jgi:hypothetical protein
MFPDRLRSLPGAVRRGLVAVRDSRLLARRAAAVATVLWFCGYAAVSVTGQSFDASYLDYGWQLVPWTILRRDPIGSVWYLHTQPPLWNLTLGSLAKLSPFADSFTLHAFMLGVGLALVYVLVGVIRALGVSPLWSVILALVITLNPEVLHNAFEPTYELAVALLLALTIRAAQRAVAGRRGIDYVWFSVALSAVVLTRSLYHPALVPLLLVGLGWFLRRSLTRRHVLVAAAIPTLLVGGWLLKNQLLYGDATTSSWFGMNLQRSTIPILKHDDLLQMHADGEISNIAMIGPFAAYDDYAPSMPACTPEHHHDALTVKGHLDAQGVFISNFNYECYLPVYDQAASDFWAVARAHPGVWWEGRVFSLRMTFATSTRPGASGSPLMRGLDKGYHLLRLDVPLGASTVGWGSPLYGEFSFTFRFSLLVTAVYGLLLMYSAVALTRRLRRHPTVLGDSVFATTAVLGGFLGAYTVVVGAVGELGEQSRFRSMTDPVVLAVGVVLMVRLLRAWLGRRQVSAPEAGG